MRWDWDGHEMNMKYENSLCDVSNNHLLAILIQTLEDDVPVNYYYSLIKLEKR